MERPAGFPLIRQQVCQVKAVIVVVVWDPGQLICQSLPGIYIQGGTAAKQGVHYGCILRCIMIATENIVLSSQGQGPDGILNKIIIDLVTDGELRSHEQRRVANDVQLVRQPLNSPPFSHKIFAVRKRNFMNRPGVPSCM